MTEWSEGTLGETLCKFILTEVTEPISKFILNTPVVKTQYFLYFYSIINQSINVKYDCNEG